MTLVKLTRPDGPPRWVNPEAVASVTDSLEHPGQTDVELTSGHVIRTRESAEAVARALSR